MTLDEIQTQYRKQSQPSLLPIYIGLSGLTAWLGMVTVILLTEIGAAPSPINELALAAAGLSAFFGAWPFVSPLVGIVAERWPSAEEAL